jgi:hypothetical protein
MITRALDLSPIYRMFRPNSGMSDTLGFGRKLEWRDGEDTLDTPDET